MSSSWSVSVVSQRIAFSEICWLFDSKPTQPRSKPEIHFDTKERETITLGNARLSELGLIEPAVHTPDEYISIICVREKKSGQYRTILNIKGPKKHIE